MDQSIPKTPYFLFLVWAYREQCVYLYVKSPYNTTYVFQKILTPSSSSIVAHFIPTFQITRIKSIQFFPNLIRSSISPYTINQSENKMTEATNSDDLTQETRPSNCLSLIGAFRSSAYDIFSPYCNNIQNKPFLSCTRRPKLNAFPFISIDISNFELIYVFTL